LPYVSSTRYCQSYAPSAGMVQLRVIKPWFWRPLSRLVHVEVFTFFTRARKRTCWPASGSVTFAWNWTRLLVQPSYWFVSATDWSAVSGRLPIWVTPVGALGGRPKLGGV